MALRRTLVILCEALLGIHLNSIILISLLEIYIGRFDGRGYAL